MMDDQQWYDEELAYLKQALDDGTMTLKEYRAELRQLNFDADNIFEPPETDT